MTRLPAGLFFGVLCWISGRFISLVRAQDYGIYGVFINELAPLITSQRPAYSTCFRGIGLTSCRPQLVTDDIALSYDRDSYKNLASLYGNFYCVDCCGDPPDYIDTWDLSCDNTLRTQSLTLNFNNMELRMARKKTLADTVQITCKFPRTNPDTTFLHGYTVTLTIQQYDSNLASWNGVSKCIIESDQRSEPLYSNGTFKEVIILKHVPIDSFSPNDPVKMTIIIGGAVVGLYVVLYVLRRKRCEYCQGKLVFSPRLCYKCVIVGAQPPDPVLLKALEERGLHMQGKPPERFGFVQIWCVGCCRGLYRCFTCQCWCACCYKCCRFLWCCGCFGLCCKDKPEADGKIYADEDFDVLTAEEPQQDIERGDDVVELFDARGGNNNQRPETDVDISKKKPKSKRRTKQEILAAEEKELEVLEKKREKNPNILMFPGNTIKKAIKHPSVV